MKDYTITLKKILGKEKYEELVDYTFKNIRNKFGNIKADKAVKYSKSKSSIFSYYCSFKS